jgi:predicted DNA-binding transcriptional regulator YafY
MWHPSQQTREQPDGSLTLTLDVCNDWALKSWILGFGGLVTVIAPATLVAEINQELDAARGNYGDGGPSANTTTRRHDGTTL